MGPKHRWPIRVYYEDTDMAGIVYYANYLKFTERARTEFVRELGIDQNRLKKEDGIVFAVRRLEADYLRPAVFDDELIIETTVVEQRPVRIVLRQDVLRGDELCFVSTVTLVALTAEGRPTRLPADIRRTP